MSDEPTLRTARLLLRPLELADAPAIQRLAGAPEIADTTLVIPHPYPAGAAERFIIDSTTARKHDHGLDLAITLADSEQLVGVIGSRFDPDSTAEVGYWIGVPSWNRGYATEALIAFARHLLLDRGLRRLRASYFTRNPASGRVLDKAGFRHIGHEDHHRARDGKIEPSEVVEITRDDLRPATAPDPRNAP